MSATIDSNSLVPPAFRAAADRSTNSSRVASSMRRALPTATISFTSVK